MVTYAVTDMSLTKTVTLRLEPELYRVLRAISHKTGVPITTHIRDIVTEYLRDRGMYIREE